MTTSVHELLERGAASPDHPFDLVAATGAAGGRRRRRRVGILAAAALVVTGCVATVAVVDRDRDDSHTVVVPPAAPTLEPVHVPDGWTSVSDPEAGIALAIPPDWNRDALDLPADPRSVLVVGNAPRSRLDSYIAACDPADAIPSASGTWVSLYEYDDVEGPFPSPDASMMEPSARPRTFFDTAPGFGPRCDRDGFGATGPVVNYADFFAFRDGGRVFYARIVTIGDPDGDGLVVGREVLDTLRVVPAGGNPTDDASATTTTTDAGVPTSTAPQAAREGAAPEAAGSQSDDEQALRAVLVAWLDGSDADETGQYVEDGDELRPLIEQGKAQHSPETLATFRGVVDDVTFIDETHASFHFTQSKLGSVLFRHLPGTAVEIDGEWKVSRETMCEHLARGGITCPPRNASGASSG